ncbi:hypothetical protein BGP76_08830 [Reichenbachiella sp. MSK19-1]|nr:hypothetical protein BGP76_08830 [Reichenbachiella sp. MSK19-1]
MTHGMHYTSQPYILPDEGDTPISRRGMTKGGGRAGYDEGGKGRGMTDGRRAGHDGWEKSGV